MKLKKSGYKRFEDFGGWAKKVDSEIDYGDGKIVKKKSYYFYPPFGITDLMLRNMQLNEKKIYEIRQRVNT